MNFNWEELLDLANDLWNQAQTANGQKREALLRSTTSRAYYAVINVTAQWLRERYPTHPLPSHGEIHQGVSDFFLFHQGVEFQLVGEMLRDLRSARHQVDYRSRVSDSYKIAQRSLFDANRVLNALATVET